jgi:2-polyprenyl-3-methyl-5-hydroxy-6-metoxy-1,4-benzoquinol methylase
VPARDRGVLATFAELVGADGGGPVVDAGCGPGRIMDHLASLGVSVRGIDLSPRMVGVARERHPGLRVDRGD